jgi:hypothetical protein
LKEKNQKLENRTSTQSVSKSKIIEASEKESEVTMTTFNDKTNKNDKKKPTASQKPFMVNVELNVSKFHLRGVKKTNQTLTILVF